MSTSHEVKVLSAWSSPFAMRPKIALNIKRVEHEVIEENLFAKSDLLLKSNPVHKKVPVLIHGDKIISESAIIVQYIDEVWASGPEILPSDPYDRAISLFWTAYVDTVWFPRLRALLLVEEDEAKKVAAEQVIEGLILLEETFPKCSKGQKFFGGDKIGFIDIALGSFLAWTRVIQIVANANLIDEIRTPHLFKWAQDFSTDDAVKDVMPETDKLYEYSKILAPKMKAAAKKQ